MEAWRFREDGRDARSKRSEVPPAAMRRYSFPGAGAVPAGHFFAEWRTQAFAIRGEAEMSLHAFQARI